MTRSGCPPFGVFSLLVSIATGSTIVPAQVAGQSLGGRVAAAARTERAPRLDGTLEDSVWKIAPIIGDFRQRDLFFQAEDGIRATSVTGVQTCALPISRRKR